MMSSVPGCSSSCKSIPHRRPPRRSLHQESLPHNPHDLCTYFLQAPSISLNFFRTLSSKMYAGSRFYNPHIRFRSSLLPSSAPYLRPLYLAGMLFRIHIIVNTNKEHLISKLKRQIRVIPVLDLPDRPAGARIPLQFYHHCRKA